MIRSMSGNNAQLTQTNAVASWPPGEAGPWTAWILLSMRASPAPRCVNSFRAQATQRPQPTSDTTAGPRVFALLPNWLGHLLIWGTHRDHFGRVRTLMLTILVYSLFTFAGAVASSVWRLSPPSASSPESALDLHTKEWPRHAGKMGAGLMQTGSYFGILIAAVLNSTVGAHCSASDVHRGSSPRYFVLIRYGVTEPSRWKPFDLRGEAFRHDLLGRIPPPSHDSQ